LATSGSVTPGMPCVYSSRPCLIALLVTG
jgi:hypothetical protein